MSSALTTKLERRIRRLVDPAADRRPLTVARALLSTCAALVLLSPVAGVRAEQVLKAPLAVSLPHATESIVAPNALAASNPLAAPKKAPRLLAQVVTQPAQLSPAGSLSGVVRDPSGAVVANATVRVQIYADAGGSTAGGGRGGAASGYSTVTGAAGQWSLPSLASGVYELEVQVPGFASFMKTVTVNPGLNNLVDTSLSLGRTRESMTVVADKSNTYTLNSPTTSQSSPRPMRVGGMVEAPKRIRVVTPVFPQTARERGVQGSITFTAIISKSGFIQDTPLTASNAPPELIQAALDAVKQWQYSPALLNGEPVDFLTEITVNFTLQ